MSTPQTSIPNENAPYRFLPGGRPYSSGVVADPGHEIVRCLLRDAPPWREGFDRIDRHLEQDGVGRPGLCAIELRCPTPHSIQGFSDFNEDYREVLQSWGLLVDGVNPVARTNVAPTSPQLSQTHLCGFSFVRPSDIAERTFVVAGGGEVRSTDVTNEAIVRFGEDSRDALGEKAGYVIQVMEKRMAGLGVGWGDATAACVYSVHDVDALIADLLVPRLGSFALHGVRRYHTRPPVENIEFEMDVRGTRLEAVL